MLNGTTAEIKPRTALRINPAKTCQPIGAMYAALGIHRCMPHSHGSQGCCAYHRSHLTRHYKDPVMATTSSFTEGSSVFGGLSNLTQALKNIFTIYQPDIVAVHTTCLSEVIGDDIPMMIKKATEDNTIPAGKHVIHTNTPSFVGSHVTGYSNMVRSIIKYLAQSSGGTRDQLNVIPGFVDPADMREIKRLCAMMGVNIVMLPDTSGVLDTPQDGHYQMYPKGGTTIEQIKGMGDSIATLALGHFGAHPAAAELEAKCNVPAGFLELPIGLTCTDKFIDALRQYGSTDVPESIEEERGRLVDLMSDLHQYFYRKRVAIAGDPDHLISMVQFLVELDMQPAYVITGTPGQHFERRIKDLLKEHAPNAVVKQNTDLFELHQLMKQEPVDLLIANTYGKYIARAENVPFVRLGFPILDRTGHRLFPAVGYTGAMRYIEKINDALLDQKDRECEEEWFELVQ
ncbi:MAG: nitrogenase molybdenum-iron protein subunit beta [Verrucomicrobiales bacterium]|jgi:nitrogenase molybdenum-iron protein beta chain|nr:nitrogenase molybdenum-iron protein subunit beta [Verrucomicrobiales bacterium]